MWRINSVEEITTTTTEEYSDEDEYSDLPPLGPVTATCKVPFPEAGIDLIDHEGYHSDQDEEASQDKHVKCTELQNWEENWLFKKRKKNECKSEVTLGYMAMILSELPVCMLIPNPELKTKAAVGDRDVDELSELSEHNSFGSLEFSDTEIETEDEERTQPLVNGVKEVINNANDIGCVGSQRVATYSSSAVKTSDANNKCNEPKVMGSAVVGSDHKMKPNVKLVANAPNFLPKELRKDMSAESDPHLVLSPGDASVQTGILVQFCCRARGTKPLSFSWFKNDTILKSDQNYRIFQSGEENVLEIRRTSLEDSAQYSCVVYNRFGYHWCDFGLEVRQTQTHSDSNANKMPTNAGKRRDRLRSNISSKSCCKGVFSSTSNNNPKHETHKTRPLVVQRTWAERVAELTKINATLESNQIETIQEPKDDIDNGKAMVVTSEPVVCLTPTIAEREHKKWETSDVELKDSPYSVENLNSRLQRRSLILSMDEESEDVAEEQPIVEDETEGDTSFLSSKSKDFSRYKKDYYIKHKNSKEETLRSLDENEYSNSKYFDLSHAKRKLSDDSSRECQEVDSILSQTYPNVADSNITMPSVRDLVNRFAKHDEKSDTVPKLVDVKRKSSFSSDPKLNTATNGNVNGNSNGHTKSQPNCSANSNHNPKNVASWQTNHSNFKVHSLTARSLTKEFREMSQLNLPRSQRHRMDFYSQNQTNSLNESESSSHSTACSPTNEGYASDESNASSGAPPVPPPVLNKNNERKFSKSILRRASYWEKRCEKGLISDSSVNEDFPPMEKFAN